MAYETRLSDGWVALNAQVINILDAQPEIGELYGSI
jgi:hypothetical protein